MRRHSLDMAAELEPTQSIEEPSEAMDLALDLPLSSAEQDDDVILQDDGRIYTPPPRIAARFYRPSQTRRRESAASSRRNSFSSAHSRCSSIQAAGAGHRSSDQSKHVAQHLRRASFLEDRRARLADRAAHAEKVRLRAALAKAAPRVSPSSEERALAAQQARERNLAEIVANCAEEVRKAKQVAGFMKEKREQDLAKMKAQIEERMAEAEKRREEFRSRTATRRSRAQSNAKKSPETSPRAQMRIRPQLNTEQAAARIQDWWRGCARRRVVEQFNEMGLTVDGIRDTSFDTVVGLLAQEKVLIITARLLRMCGLVEGEPGSVNEMAAVRSFLSAYLILGHPHQVLANKNEGEADAFDDALGSHHLPSADLDNPQLQDLVSKAKDLLIAFETILARFTVVNRFTMPPVLKNTLPEAYAVFYNAFIAWKSRDSNALIEVMLMQFVELDAIFQTVKDTTDDAAAALYRQSIQDSQMMLIVRIKKLAGPEKGKKMIFDAVRQARKSRKPAKRVGDTKPRVAEASSGEASASNPTITAEPQTLTPPSTPGSKAQPKPMLIKTGLSGLLPDNRIVVHELAINREYQVPTEDYKALQAEAAEPLYARIKDAMNDTGNDVSFQIFALMGGAIKGKLQKLLKPGNSMYNLIGEILDPEMAQQQFNIGNFSYEKFFAAMASLLPKLCAPFRDEEVKVLAQSKLREGDIVDRVRALNGFIDVMLCDYINYLLTTAAPQLIESAAAYEAKRFTEDVEQGRISLQVAESAWKSARSKVISDLQKRDPEGINHPKSRPNASRFYAQMLVDVFTQPAPVSMEQVPEMLRLDLTRINEVSVSVRRIVTVGAVLLQCKNILKRDVRSPWKTEASRIMTVLEAEHSSIDTTVDGAMAALEAGRSMPGATKVQLRALVTRVLTASRDMAQSSSEPTEPVLRLLLTRLRGNILTRLTAQSASDKVKATNTAGEKLASLGLSEFVEKVRHISDLLDKVGSIDRTAHAPWWDAIATKVEQDE